MLIDSEVETRASGADVKVTDDVLAAEGVDLAADADDTAENTVVAGRRFAVPWPLAVAYGLLPAAVLILAIVAGFLKWQDASVRSARDAGVESVAAARDGTIALLSYKPDTVEQDLESARSRMTGTFLDSYTSLTHDVVIPGAKQKQISAEATVPAAASVSATGDHAVVLLFVNQTVNVGKDPATNTGSSVRVTLDKVHGRWLISGFDPV